MTGTDTFFANMQQSMIVEAKRKVAGEIRKLKTENNKLKKELLPQRELSAKKRKLENLEKALIEREKKLSIKEQQYVVDIRKKFSVLFSRLRTYLHEFEKLKTKPISYMFAHNYLNDYWGTKRREIQKLEKEFSKIKPLAKGKKAK